MLNERDEQSWNTKGVSIGDVFRLDQPGFEKHIGPAWAKKKAKLGDLIVAVRHSGDGFFDCLLLDATNMSGRTAMSTGYETFGNYAVGTFVTNIGLDDVEKLLAGEVIDIETPESMAEPTTKPFSMRGLPTTTRVVLAGLGLRHRAARMHARHLQDAFGAESPAAIHAIASEIECWNSLQAARSQVMDEVAGERVTVGDAHAFMRHAALAAASAKRARARREIEPA